MVALSALWIPIVVSAIFVFIASSIIHMVLPLHKNDYAKLPDEDGLMEAMRKAGVQPGAYVFPRVSSGAEFKDPAVIAKFDKGPVGMMTVIPSGAPNMGKYLGMWFLFCVIISFFSAYLAGRLLAPGTHYLTVFRVVGTVSFMAYGVGEIGNSIWKNQPWGITIRNMIGGLVYALVTAGAFGWLWPR